MSKLSQRQSKFLEELPRSKSVSEAARRAGYSPKYAGQAGYLALKRIAEKAPDLLDDMEKSLMELIEKSIKPGLDAKKTVYFKYRGKITDQREVPDWTSRLETLDMVFRILGAYRED